MGVISVVALNLLIASLKHVFHPSQDFCPLFKHFTGYWGQFKGLNLQNGPVGDHVVDSRCHLNEWFSGYNTKV